MIIPCAALHGIVPMPTVTVRTFAASTVDAYGRTIDGAATDTSETMPVHPAGKRQLERLPTADHQRETIALYPLAGTALARASGSRPPQVLYAGRWYEVASDADYDATGGARTILAQLKDTTA